MNSSYNRWTACAVLASALLSNPARAADNPQDVKKVSASLAAQRIRPNAGSVVKADDAGYFRVVIASDGLTRDNLCPVSDADRDKLKNLEASIWSWALKRKKDWGAAAQIVYDGSNPDFDKEGFTPNLALKFFSVRQNSSSAARCETTGIDFSSFETPLIALGDGYVPQRVQVQFSTWYNDIADRDRIEKMATGGSFAIGLLGVPAALLQQVVPIATDEIKRTIDRQTASKYKIALDPFTADNIGATAYLGLREPREDRLTSEPRVTLTIKPVASMFRQSEASFASVDMSATPFNDILRYKVPAVGSNGQLGQEDLQVFLTRTTPMFLAMLNAPNFDAMSENCENLDRVMIDTLKLSRVDAAIILHAVARQKAAANPAFAQLGKLSCLTDPARSRLLGKVKIAIPAVTVPGIAVTRDQMADAMKKLAQLRATPGDLVTSDQWSFLAFPLLVTDPANRFGWDNQQKRFASEDRAAFKTLLETQFTNIGCWAYFDAPPFDFALGLGESVPPGSASLVRKSAALVRLANGDVAILQLRYPEDPAPPKVAAMSLVNADSAARERMIANDSCKDNQTGKEWMQPFLRPQNAPAQRSSNR